MPVLTTTALVLGAFPVFDGEIGFEGKIMSVRYVRRAVSSVFHVVLALDEHLAAAELIPRRR